MAECYDSTYVNKMCHIIYLSLLINYNVVFQYFQKIEELVIYLIMIQ